MQPVLNEARLFADDPKALMTPDQASEYMGVAEVTLRLWRGKGSGPRYVKLGDGKAAHIRYRRVDLDAYIEKCIRRSTSDGAQL